MPTHLYCLLPRSADVPAPSLEGIGGAPVRALDAGALSAWVSTLPDPAPVADTAALRAHDAVASAALEHATPLPARFGQRYESDEACVSALESRAAALAAKLSEVSGCVEMRVLLAPRSEPPLQSTPVARSASTAGRGRGTGRAYLEEVRSRVRGARELHERGAALRESLLPAIGTLARRDAVAVRPKSAAPVALAYLVRREDAGAWRVAAERALEALALPGDRIVLAGPVAPYSFAEIADAAAG